MAHEFKNDFQTPPEIARYMVSLIPETAKSVCEPTPGQGNIVRELHAAGYEVTAPEDYFLLQKDRFDCILMNPPFSRKFLIVDNAPEHFLKPGMRVGYQIFTDCLQMSDTVIALMPVFTIIDSDVRLRRLKEYGMKSITLLPRKTFQYARIQTAVFEMQRGYEGDTLLHAYDILKKKATNTMQSELFQ